VTKKTQSSDQVIFRTGSMMKLLLFNDNALAQKDVVLEMIRKAGFPSWLLSEKSVIKICADPSASDQDGVLRILSKEQIEGQRAPRGYDESSFMRRLGYGTKCAILRPDLYSFACASTLGELDVALMAFHDLAKFQ
jgi:hypothetical protein